MIRDILSAGLFGCWLKKQQQQNRDCVSEICLLIILFLMSAGFKQSPPSIPSPNINIRKRRHGDEEIYYIPVRMYLNTTQHDIQ